jgi:hypothetical protein
MKTLIVLATLALLVASMPAERVVAATCPADSGVLSISVPAHKSFDIFLDTACETSTGIESAAFSHLNLHGGGMGADIFDSTGSFIGGGSSSGEISAIGVSGHAATPGIYTLRVYNPNNQKIKMDVEFQITP